MAQPHYPHPYDPKNKAVIHRIWKEKRKTYCPVAGANVKVHTYIGTFVEYTFKDKSKKDKYVEEFCLLVQWVD